MKSDRQHSALTLRNHVQGELQNIVAHHVEIVDVGMVEEFYLTSMQWGIFLPVLH